MCLAASIEALKNLTASLEGKAAQNIHLLVELFCAQQTSFCDDRFVQTPCSQSHRRRGIALQHNLPRSTGRQQKLPRCFRCELRRGKQHRYTVRAALFGARAAAMLRMNVAVRKG